MLLLAFNDIGVKKIEKDLNKLHQLYRKKRYREVARISKGMGNTFLQDSRVSYIVADSYRHISDYDTAIAILKSSLSNYSKLIDSYFLLGKCYKHKGMLDNEESTYLKALVVQPKNCQLWNLLGGVYFAKKDWARGEACYTKTLGFDVHDFAANWALGIFYISLGKYEVAARCFKNIIDYDDCNDQAYNALGACYNKLGYLLEAVKSFDKALLVNSDNSEIFSNKAKSQIRLFDFKGAALSFKSALDIEPENLNIIRQIAETCLFSGDPLDALGYYDRYYGLTGDKEFFDINSSLVYCYLGDYSSATEAYFDPVVLAGSEDSSQVTNRLFCLNYHPDISGENILKCYENLVAKIYRNETSEVRELPSLDGRKLRVGFISADFNYHVCRYFYDPIFENYNSNKYEVYIYSNVSTEDRKTESLKRRFKNWRHVLGKPADKVASLIQDDGVDVLVDLSGHTSGHRLDVVSLKPAPVQVSYLGYGHTTGMPQIDYFIGDDNFTPIGCEDSFSEKILRLDGPAFCYKAPAAQSMYPDLPAKKNGFVTFGSLSRTIRFNDSVLITWARILERVDNSRLRIDTKLFSNAREVKWYRERLVRLGLPIDRVDLCSSDIHWDSYGEIDICLDPFPHNGGTTIFESIWMGVPTLSKRDRPPVGRFGACILTPLGLEDWLVSSEDEYVEKAVEFASDLDSLEGLRRELRTRMSNSPLMEEKRFADDFMGHLEKAYRKKCLEAV